MMRLKGMTAAARPKPAFSAASSTSGTGLWSRGCCGSFMSTATRRPRYSSAIRAKPIFRVGRGSRPALCRLCLARACGAALPVLVVFDAPRIPQVGSLPGGGSVWPSQGPAGYYKFRHSRSGIMVRTDTSGAAPGGVDSIQGRPAWAQRLAAAE